MGVDVSLFTRYDWFRGTAIENTSNLSRRAMTWNKYNCKPKYEYSTDLESVLGSIQKEKEIT